MLRNKIKIGKIKIVVLVMAIFVVLCTITVGTYAWLSGKTPLLNSKFTYGDIEISINESNVDEDGIISHEMMPGIEIKKDPIITVEANSEDCWLFVKLNKSDNFDNFMTYELEDEWILLEEETMVYYREVSKKDIEQKFKVIKNDVVKVKPELTRQDLSLLDETEEYPVLMVTAYAVQRNSKIDVLSTASNAWILLDVQE